MLVNTRLSVTLPRQSQHPPLEDIHPNRTVDYSEAYGAVCDTAEEWYLLWRSVIHEPTKQHELTAGQIALALAEAAGLGSDDTELAAVTAGLHDDGKYHADVLKQITRKDDFGHEIRDWVRTSHTSRGRVQLRNLAEQANGARRERLLTASFVAGEHHSPVPEDYLSYDSRHSKAWGLTHLTKVADVLAALAFDPSRKAYIKDREGSLPTSERILGIVLQASGNDPVISGKRIPVAEYVTGILRIPTQR